MEILPSGAKDMLRSATDTLGYGNNASIAASNWQLLSDAERAIVVRIVSMTKVCIAAGATSMLSTGNTAPQQATQKLCSSCSTKYLASLKMAY